MYYRLVSLAETVKQRALEIGFDLAGIAPLSAWRDLEFSRQWVEKGFGGEMHYLSSPRRDDPRLLLPSAKSVVCVGLVYNADLPYSTEVSAGRETQDVESRAPRAWISRYAWGRDYHDVMRAKLEELRRAIEAFGSSVDSAVEKAGGTPVETRVYVDTGPIIERAFARLSGIGWMGKNTCLINQRKGSWFFLGVILTNLELAPDLPAPDRCGSCTRCLEACPTGALVEPYVMDASRCIAYFTIELKGSIPETLRPAIEANVFGCDICQDVCPWNSRSQELVDRSQNHANGNLSSATSLRPRKVATTGLAEFQPLAVETAQRAVSCDLPAAESPPPVLDPERLAPAFSLFNPPLEALASFTEDDFKRIFARSPIKRTKYRGWLRNLCVAMGNSGDRRFLPWLERARQHEDLTIREHADWAMGRLTRP